MKSKLMRSVIGVSLLTALVGTALAIYGPQVAEKMTSSNDGAAVTLTPAQYNSPAPANDTYVQPAQRRAVRSAAARPAASQATYSEPTVRRDRSTGKSVAIVAGSAGAGAAIGALTGGGKGAAIGALAGGAGGFIYDRMTAHKQ